MIRVLFHRFMKHIIVDTNPKTIAIQLRRDGYLYSEIALQLHIAKSTAYAWTKDVALTEEQQALIKARHRNAQLKKIEHLAILKREVQERQQTTLRTDVQTMLKDTALTVNHKKLLCAVLVWCEGSKRTSEGVRFINSDPVMIMKFLSLLRESFDVNESKFRALVHLHGYHDPEKQQQYWSELTRIPRSQFIKPYSHTSSRTRARTLVKIILDVLA